MCATRILDSHQRVYVQSCPFHAREITSSTAILRSGVLPVHSLFFFLNCPFLFICFFFFEHAYSLFFYNKHIHFSLATRVFHCYFSLSVELPCIVRWISVYYIYYLDPLSFLQGSVVAELFLVWRYQIDRWPFLSEWGQCGTGTPDNTKAWKLESNIS